MFEIILVIILAVVVWKILRSYRLTTYDTIVSFTGGLGSGKSLMSVDMAIKLLHRKRREVKWKNLFRKRGEKLPEPLLYSSIPVRISKKEMAAVLTDKHLTLQEKLVRNSVVFIDEIGSFCSQFDFKAKNADIFDEFIRFYRHYTKGGFIVCNDQCSENIVLQVRRRLNTVYNLMGFRKWFGLFYTVHVRNISVSEEIKTIEEQNAEDNTRILFGLLPFTRRYDTWCYAPRYDYVPDAEPQRHAELTKIDILRLPKKELLALDTRIQAEKRRRADAEIDRKEAEIEKSQEILQNLLTNKN